jgi:hypothetical protein
MNGHSQKIFYTILYIQITLIIVADTAPVVEESLVAAHDN